MRLRTWLIYGALAGVLVLFVAQKVWASAISPGGSSSPVLAAGSNTIGSVKVTDGTHTATVSAGGAVLTDASATTQPVSAASLPLPTGASTETTLAKLPVAQGSTTSGQSGALVQGAVTTSAPTYTTAQTSPLSLTTAGALRVDGSAVTQPASLASLPALATGTAAIGHLDSTSTLDGDAHENSSISISSSAGGTTVLSAAAGRRSLMICNVDTVTLSCNLGTAAAPTTLSFGFGLKADTVGGATPAFNGGCQPISGWSGAVVCIAASGTGHASVVAF